MFAKRKRNFALYAVGFILLLGLSAGAQEVRFTSTSQSLEGDSSSKLQVSLQRLVQQYETTGEVSRVAPAFELTRRLDLPQHGGTRPSLRMNNNRVQIVVETYERSDLATISRWIESHGGAVEVASRGSIQAQVPIVQLEALSTLGDVSFVRLPIRFAPKASLAQGDRISEGVETIGSGIWNNAGLDGEGVKVGILDQFGRYRSLMGSELPSSDKVTIRSFASHGEIFDPEGPEGLQSHGTSVAEIIYDIAPGASHHLAYFETLVEFTDAADWLIDQEVNVINTSLGFDSACFRDGDGLFESIFQDANDAGITWASAAGNEADIHYLDQFNDPDNDLRHDFTTGDEGNTVETVLTELELGDGSVVATAEFFAIYSWDASCTNASDDYEMVLMREVNGFLEVVPSDNLFNDWFFEPGRPIKFFFGFFDYDVGRAGEEETFHIGFRKKNPLAEDVRIMALHYGCFCFSIEYVTTESSVGILEPGVSPNVIAVGAAHSTATDCPRNPSQGFHCPDGRLFFYSSQGPTKDGRQKPELVAPSHVSTVTSGRHTGESFNANPGFTGTSASTPHVVGAAALVVQALRAQGMEVTPDSVLAFLQNRAEDLGDPGIDNAYGAGLLTLGQPPVDLQPEPSFESITPTSGLQDSSLDATINGENLDLITEVVFSGEGVSATINSSSSSTLDIQIEIAPDAELGDRTLQLLSENATAENGEVVFTVLQGPTLDVGPDELSFSGTEGAESPESQELSVGNTGEGGFVWSATSDVDWITITPSSGVLDITTSVQTASVSINTEMLEAGQHTGTITVAAEGALNGPISIPVTLTLEEAPQPPVVEGELIALKFIELEFVNASDWERVSGEGCVTYTNVAEEASPVSVILPDGTTREFTVPAGNEVIVCGDVVHIDSRVAASAGEDSE